MADVPSVLALRPGTKMSKADREALKAVGIVVVSVAPENVAAIQTVNILPANDMLRCALDTINNVLPNYGQPVQNSLRAEFGRRVIETFLAYGETSSKPDAAHG